MEILARDSCAAQKQTYILVTTGPKKQKDVRQGVTP